jgi:hypothetical protein
MRMVSIPDFLVFAVEWLILTSVCFALIALTIQACVTDARRRGKSPLLVTLAVLFFFPLGLIAWLLFRPEPLDGAGSGRSFRLEDHRVQ